VKSIIVKEFAGIELAAWEEDYRVQDVVVGERLGFARPEDVRRVIRKNAKELNDYGILATSALIHDGAGRPTESYYLNEEQALLVAMFSRTEKAAEVRRDLIKAFKFARLTATDSYIFNKLFLPEPVHTGYLWSVERLAPIARLYGVTYTGGRPPVETRYMQRLIYDLVIGCDQIKSLRERNPDPPGTNGEPYIYDHFHPAVRAAFEHELDLYVVREAKTAHDRAEFVERLRHVYQGRSLQTSLFRRLELVAVKKEDGK
jgi:hypothetical protein